MTQQDDAQALRDAGLRVTSPRLAVLAAVRATPHADADTVATVARATIGSVSTQATYNSLHALVDAGLIRRIQPTGHPARYEARVGDNHHHAVCRSCDATVDIDCHDDATTCLPEHDVQGFQVDHTEVVYWGTCTDCAPTQP